MTLHQCPACLGQSTRMPGESLGYVQFDCAQHGKFEIHERIAAYLIKPESAGQRSKISFQILELRAKSPNAILKLTQQPAMTQVIR